MKACVKWVLVVTTAVGSFGCVSQKRADDLETLNRHTQEQVTELQVQLEAKRAEIAALQDQMRSQGSSSSAQLQSAKAEHARLAAALEDAESRLRRLAANPILEPEVDLALVKLVDSNPQLMGYDPQLGMVKFSSDLTFALGSTEISAEAVNSLEKLGKILNSNSGRDYVISIVGHTDSVPIRRAQTLQDHRTNWHLSVHRAIAVKDVLTNAKVSPARIAVAGHGEHQPIAPNAKGGNKANRRVEIYLLPPSHARAGSWSNTAKPEPGQAQSAATTKGDTPPIEDPYQEQEVELMK